MSKIRIKYKNSIKNKHGIIIMVLSCNQYLNTRATNCRSTWMKDAKKRGVEALFTVGRNNIKKPILEEDILYLPCGDDYMSLPQKMSLFCKWLFKNRNFDYLFKCDDDTYVVIDRLINYNFDGYDYIGTYERGDFCSGGAGYFLSKKAVKIIANEMVEARGPEDVIVRNYMVKNKVLAKNDSRFQSSPGVQPKHNNGVITSHYVGDMQKIYSEFNNSDFTVSKILTGGRLGNKMFEVASVIGYSCKYKTHKPVFDLNALGNMNVFGRLNSSQTNNNIAVFGEEHAYKYTEIPYHNGDVLISGYRQSPKYFDFARGEIIDLLGPSDAVVCELKNKFKNELYGTTIGMHVRRGDYVNLQHIYFLPDRSYYLTAIDTIKKKTKIDKILCFSDDLNWCRENFKDIKNIVFIPHQRDYMDLYLMSMCSHNIISASSFSWWGAWLNANVKKIIVSPSQWFRFLSPLEDLVPNSWIKEE